MANFKTAYNSTMSHEGGYVNDEDDRGGETYKGIARNFHPDWEGWKIIDSIKVDGKLPSSVVEMTDLETHVFNFYKEKFWDVVSLDSIGSQSLANEIFDNAVNMGVTKAVLFIQEAVNLLNNNGKLYSDISEDGLFGSQTLNAIKVCLARRGERLLLNLVNFHQMEHYVGLMRKKKVYEKYIGWFNRVEIRKV